MNAKAHRRDTLSLSGIFCLAMVSVASGCGGPSSDQESLASSAPPSPEGTLLQAPAPGTSAGPGGSGELVAGGMDSGGSSIAPSWNESPNGAVTTTLGDFVVGVRSDSAIYHRFREARPGAPEYLSVRHQLRTRDNKVFTFEVQYTDDLRSFALQERGFLAIRRDGEDLVSHSGNVTIEPIGSDAIRVSFDQVTVRPDRAGENEPVTPEFIGSGVVEGPLRRICSRASDAVYADGNVPPTPDPVHDAAWIEQFCSAAATE